jgi:hypothetical protein
MANDILSNGIFSQVGKKHMASLIKITNGVLLKMANVITTYIPTYLATNLLQHTYLPIYPPTH